MKGCYSGDAQTGPKHDPGMCVYVWVCLLTFYGRGLVLGSVQHFLERLVRELEKNNIIYHKHWHKLYDNLYVDVILDGS